MYYYNGNLGIGTTGPGAKLEVAEQVKITGGTPGANKVLTSDATGLASWAAVAGVPSGVIVMWSGLLSNIPSGWALCDGTSGTPDLRDRFIYGVAASENPGATGGSHTYSLAVAQLPSHNHTIAADGVHTHSVLTTLDAYTYGIAVVSETSVNATKWTSGYVSNAGSHTHGGATGSVGSGSSIDNRPAYFKLAFIMKL